MTKLETIGDNYDKWMRSEDLLLWDFYSVTTKAYRDYENTPGVYYIKDKFHTSVWVGEADNLSYRLWYQVGGSDIVHNLTTREELIGFQWAFGDPERPRTVGRQPGYSGPVRGLAVSPSPHGVTARHGGRTAPPQHISSREHLISTD